MSTSTCPQQVYPAYTSTGAFYSPTLNFAVLPCDAEYKLEYFEDVWSIDTLFEYSDNHGSSATDGTTSSPPTSASPSTPSSRASSPSLFSGCKRLRDSDSNDEEPDVYPVSGLGSYLAHYMASPSSRKRTRLWSEALPVPGYIWEPERHNRVFQHYSNVGCISHTNTQPEGFQKPEFDISVIPQINSFVDEMQEVMHSLILRLPSTQIHTPKDPESFSDRAETGLEGTTSPLECDDAEDYEQAEQEEDPMDDEQGALSREHRGDAEGGQDEGTVFPGPASAGSAMLVDGFYTPVATPHVCGVKRSKFDATDCATDTSATSSTVAREDDEQANTKDSGDDLLDEYPAIVTYTKIKDILNMYPHACITYVPRH